MAELSTSIKKNIERLRSGRVLLAAIVLGSCFGLYFPSQVGSLKFVINTYLDLLKVLVLPLILCAIFLNIQIISKERFFGKISLRSLTVLAGISCIAAVIGMLGALLFQPGSDISLQSLGKIDRIVGSDFADQVTRINLSALQSAPAQPVLDRLVESIVPSNIFFSLAQGEVIKVAIFAVFFGFAIASVPSRLTGGFNQSLQSLMEACNKISSILQYLVPVIAFLVAAGITAQIGREIVAVMSKFMLAFLMSVLVIFVASVWVLKERSQSSYKQVWSALYPSLAISWTSAQFSTACIPQMIETLSVRLGFSRDRVELLVPLAATFVRAVPILFFSMAAVFVAQIYVHPLSWWDLLVVFALAIGQGLASSSLRGQQKLALLAVICNPLGLPNEAVLMLLLTVEPLCEALGGVGMVVSQCAAVSMICNKPVRV